MKINSNYNYYSNNTVFKEANIIPKDQLVKLLKQGYLVSEIAEALGVPVSKVHTFIKKYGLMAARENERVQNRKMIIDLYRRGNSIEEIVQKTGIWPETVKNTLINANVYGRNDLVSVKDPLLRQLMNSFGLKASDIKDIIK